MQKAANALLHYREANARLQQENAQLRKENDEFRRALGLPPAPTSQALSSLPSLEELLDVTTRKRPAPPIEVPVKVEKQQAQPRPTKQAKGSKAPAVQLLVIGALFGLSVLHFGWVPTPAFSTTPDHPSSYSYPSRTLHSFVTDSARLNSSHDTFLVDFLLLSSFGESSTIFPFSFFISRINL